MKHEIKPLTGLRGVAAVVVMLYHFGEPYQPLDVKTYFRVPCGYMAVDFFYVLSGFVLAYAYGSQFRRLPGIRHFGVFLLKRVARLYPAYLAAMLLTLGKMSVNFTGENTFREFRLRDIAGNLLMMTGWGLNFMPVVANSWSVSAELVCYFAFPVLLLATVYGGRNAGIMMLLMAVAGLTIVSMFGHGVKGPLDVVMKDSLYPLLRALCGFTIGLLAFRCWQVPAWRARLASDTVFVVLLGLFFVGYATRRPDVMLYIVIPPIVVALASGGTTARKLFANPLAVWLGDISYSLYLFHDIFPPIAVRLTHILQSHTGMTNLYPPIAGLGITIACILAWLSYRWIEIPGRSLIMSSFRQNKPVSAV